jgi:hypothetical protein
MSARGTAIDRVLNFYRSASPDTVRVTHQLALEVMAERGIGGKKVKQVLKRGRKPKPPEPEAMAARRPSTG